MSQGRETAFGAWKRGRRWGVALAGLLCVTGIATVWGQRPNEGPARDPRRFDPRSGVPLNPLGQREHGQPSGVKSGSEFPTNEPAAPPRPAVRNGIREEPRAVRPATFAQPIAPTADAASRPTAPDTSSPAPRSNGATREPDPAPRAAGSSTVPETVADSRGALTAQPGLAGQTSLSQTTNSAPGKSPEKVFVGMYVNHIEGVSLKDSKVSVDFHLWFRWKDPTLKPHETFELINAKIDNRQDLYTDISGGYFHSVVHLQATLIKVWNVSNYPLDKHTIAIAIEDSRRDETELVFVADDENTAMNTAASVAGWDLTFHRTFVKSFKYLTNYGDIDLPAGHATVWSRCTLELKIDRPGYGMFLKLFTGLFIATIVSFLSTLIRAQELDARLGLSVGAMFAAVASEYIVVSSLPESNYLTLADKLHVMSFLFIFASLAESALVYKLVNKGNETAVRTVDSLTFLGLTAIYVLMVAWMVMYQVPTFD